MLRFTGREDSTGNSVFTSLTFGSTSFSETFIGHVTSFDVDGDPNTTTDDTYAGTVTALTAKIGAATVTFSGSLTLTGDDVSAALTGTVTGVGVALGSNSIKMTGLSVDIDMIEAALASDTLSTVNDLFSIVGDQLTGNDVITYTNNSGVGMSFFSGGGDDTIVIKGNSSDTLNGSAGNDTLDGGVGQDTITGGTGGDQITILVTAGNVDTIDAGDGTDTLVLRGVVPGNHEVVVDLSQADQVVSIGGTSEALIQTNFENLNASGIGSVVTVTGSAGANVLIGSKGNDTMNGGAGNDTLDGGLGNDVLEGDEGDDTMIGGLGNDTYKFGYGDEQDLIQDSSGVADKLSLDRGSTVIDPGDLILSRQVNDLRIALQGSSDQVTIQNWYTSPADRIEMFEVGNGEALLSSQVDQLIQAMASFQQQTGLSWEQAAGGAGTTQQQADFQNIIAAAWQ